MCVYVCVCVCGVCACVRVCVFTLVFLSSFPDKHSVMGSIFGQGGQPSLLQCMYTHEAAVQSTLMWRMVERAASIGIVLLGLVVMVVCHPFLSFFLV